MLSDGKTVTIDSIEVEELVTPETTYNFEVADFHTYYVTDSKVLVHNTCAKIDGKDVYRGGDFSAESVKGHYKVDTNGNVLPTRGPSVNTMASEIPSRFKLSKITSLPNGLTYKQVGQSLTHFEIIPSRIMKETEYLKLLSEIGLSIL